MPRDLTWERHERDVLFRWIRAARLVAQEDGSQEADAQAMKKAAARLVEYLARKREEPRPGGRPRFGRLDAMGAVLPASPHARKSHAELVPPSDWLVDAVARHEGWLRAIAERIGDIR